MLAFIAPTAGCVDIDIAIALARFLVVHCHRGQVTIVPSLAVELLSRLHHPLPSRRALHHPLVTIAPFIAAHRCCALGPTPAALAPPPLAVEEPPHAAPRRQGAVTPSLTVEEPQRRPSPSRSRRAVHCRQGAIASYLAIKELSAVLTDDSGHSSCPSKPLVRLVVTLPLLTLPPPI